MNHLLVNLALRRLGCAIWIAVWTPFWAKILGLVSKTKKEILRFQKHHGELVFGSIA